MNKNTEQFQWTDELVKEYGEWFKQKSDTFSSNPLFFVEEFIRIKSKYKTEQPLWEILSFKSNDNNLLILDGNKWKYRNDTNAISDIDFLIKNYIIHSVKRLPDNTVWSVDGYDCFGKIKSFYIKGGRMYVLHYDNVPPYVLSELKAPKGEQVPIKVLGLLDGINTDNPPYGKYYTLIFDNPIPTEKYHQSIKEAIEDVLNGKSKGRFDMNSPRNQFP